MGINTFFILHNLLKNQWKTKEELEELQNKKLRHMVGWSYRHVRFYRDLFNSAGISPEDIRDKSDLEKIPVTTKEAVQERFRDFIPDAVDLSRCRIHRTSGSTGKPLSVLYNRKSLEYSTALMLRPFLENGYTPTQLMAKYGNPKLFPKKKTFIQKIGLFREIYLSIYEDPISHINILNKAKPESLYGYSSILSLLADAFISNGKQTFQPKSIFSTAELITKSQRNLIKNAFNQEVNDMYGSVEFYRMAWECKEHDGYQYHIDSDSLILEFLKNGAPVSPGTEGKIIVTGLYNFAMPLIRYEIGDVGVPLEDECSCGRNLPLMKMVNGRCDDFLILPNGRKISPIIMDMADIEGIKCYQTIQETKKKIVVRFVRSSKYDKNTKALIMKEMEKELKGTDVDVSLEEVDEIARDKGGKIRTVISYVKG